MVLNVGYTVFFVPVFLLHVQLVLKDTGHMKKKITVRCSYSIFDWMRYCEVILRKLVVGQCTVRSLEKHLWLEGVPASCLHLTSSTHLFPVDHSRLRTFISNKNTAEHAAFGVQSALSEITGRSKYLI